MRTARVLAADGRRAGRGPVEPGNTRILERALYSGKGSESDSVLPRGRRRDQWKRCAEAAGPILPEHSRVHPQRDPLSTRNLGLESYKGHGLADRSAFADSDQRQLHRAGTAHRADVRGDFRDERGRVGAAETAAEKEGLVLRAVLAGPAGARVAHA